jgi:hypothetical protein
VRTPETLLDIFVHRLISCRATSLEVIFSREMKLKLPAVQHDSSHRASGFWPRTDGPRGIGRQRLNVEIAIRHE